MAVEPLHALVIAPHPDDAEIFCGGTLATLATAGHRTGILDCTEGELGTRGSVEQRYEEAAAAGQVLQVSYRENLKLPDGGIDPHGDAVTEADGTSQLVVLVRAIRRLKPEVVFIPYREDRHPDHEATAALCRRALFFANLPKFDADALLERHAPKLIAEYIMRNEAKPSFITDISAGAEQKRKAIACYATQTRNDSPTPENKTLLSSPLSVSSLEARDAYYGAMIGTAAGEGFVTETALRIDDPVHYAAGLNDALFFESK